MIYRLKQFFNAMTAKITEADRKFYKKYLSHQEVMLFEKLKHYDQKHSLQVAYLIEEKTSGNPKMIKAGLLHDIGKQVYPLGPFQKGIMVILDRLTKGRIKSLNKWKMVRGYYEHPDFGYQILEKEACYDEEFLELIKCHHMKSGYDQNIKAQLYILQEADNES